MNNDKSLYFVKVIGESVIDDEVEDAHSAILELSESDIKKLSLEEIGKMVFKAVYREDDYYFVRIDAFSKLT